MSLDLTVTDITFYFLVQATHLHICTHRVCVMFPSKPAFKIKLVLHFLCRLHKEGVSLCFPSPGVPPVPESPHIRERPKGGILEVKWTGASSNFTLPVVYIVESRWTVGAQHSETPFTHWQQISQVIGR